MQSNIVSSAMPTQTLTKVKNHRVSGHALRLVLDTTTQMRQFVRLERSCNLS